MIRLPLSFFFLSVNSLLGGVIVLGSLGQSSSSNEATRGGAAGEARAERGGAADALAVVGNAADLPAPADAAAGSPRGGLRGTAAAFYCFCCTRARELA